MIDEMLALVHERANERARSRLSRYAAAHPEEARELAAVETDLEQLRSDVQRAFASTDPAEAVRYAERAQCAIVDVALRRQRAFEHFARWMEREEP